MKRSTKYVALDGHQATTVASVREESGRVIVRTIVPTEAAALLALFRGMRGAIHVAFEGGDPGAMAARAAGAAGRSGGGVRGIFPRFRRHPCFYAASAS
jgi:hypothetical protein